MNKLENQLLLTSACVALGVLLWAVDSVPAEASEKNGYDFPNSGIATVLSPGSFEIEQQEETEEKLNIYEKFEKTKERMLTEVAMANVSNTLNVRSDADEESDKVGYLYRDCGGTILEQKDGWTKIQSGSLTGWCSDEFLLFGAEAETMAEDVGRWLVTINSEAVRVREEPSSDAQVIGLLSKTDYAEFVEIVDEDWISVDFEGDLGYINTGFINIDFHIDEGETMEQVKTRATIEERLRKEAEIQAAKEAAEKAAKKAKENLGELNSNRGAVAADADERRLLGALIYCEAGNQPYEGQVAVGAVVMNRVKSPAYPNTIYSVIYASGQFTPALSGKVARVYESGVPAICLQAAAAALNGETTVGGATHFRRNNGRAGYVLGAHVFW